MTFGVSFTITGMRVCCLHQRVTISTYSGTWPTAEPMLRSRHAVRAAEIQLDAVAAGVFHPRQDALPAFLGARHHQADHHRAVRPVALDLLDLVQVDLQRPVGDQLDVVEAGDPRAVVADARRSGC